MSTQPKPARCSCAHNRDGSVTTMLCPAHAETDPCVTTAQVTGKRRKGTITRGTCTNCGWQDGNTFKAGDAIEVTAYRATLRGTVNEIDGQWVRFTITSVPYWDHGASEYRAGYRRSVDYRQCKRVA